MPNKKIHAKKDFNTNTWPCPTISSSLNSKEHATVAKDFVEEERNKSIIGNSNIVCSIKDGNGISFSEGDKFDCTGIQQVQDSSFVFLIKFQKVN